MTLAGVHAARQLVGQVSDLIVSLTAREWQLPSGCAGWRVQDVVAHLASGAHTTVEPQQPSPGLTAEQQMDAMVAARHEWSADQVVQEYLEYAMPAVDLMAGLQNEPHASTVVPLLDLGNYPVSILPDVVAFDHYCHLHVDVLAPHGPVEREHGVADDDILRPAIGWMLLGLPQMQGRDLDVLRVPLVLNLSGPGGGAWLLKPAGPEGPITVTAAPAHTMPDVTIVRSATTDFVRWATQRAPWRAHVDISGRSADVESFLDRLNII
jgi:uncharacterized protein (TIGR03083 family)